MPTIALAQLRRAGLALLVSPCLLAATAAWAQAAEPPPALVPVPPAGVVPKASPQAGVPSAAALNPPAVGDVGPGRRSPLPPEQLAAAANTSAFDPAQPLPVDQSPLVLKIQILLVRAHASPGSIDGFKGGNLGKAIAAVQTMRGLTVTGALDAETWRALNPHDAGPVIGTYTITAEDEAGPFVPEIPTDYAKLATLKRVAYRNPGEDLAERFHMSEDFLRQLNPGEDFTHVGDRILVADVGQPARDPVLRLVADKSRRQLLGYGEGDRLVVAYPATIGSESLPSPSGTHTIEHVVYNAEYWYRPDVNFKQGDNDKALRIAPGPNNPIGAVWIDLSKPTYGIHGTPEPDKIDKTSSHGCVRLTNWDVEELGHLVKKGVTVEFRD